MKPLPFLILLAVFLATALGLGSCGEAPKPKTSSLEGGKILMMHYMPWYATPAVRDQWGRHWTGHQDQHDPEQIGEDGRPDIWSNFHPLIGTYDSTDPDVIECHLLQMKLAGINGVIVDWYGIGQSADYPSIHTASQAMFEATGRFGMKFAACYEDRSVEYMVKQEVLDPDQVTAHLSETLDWMQREWFVQSHYLRVEDQPLLLNFGPIYLKNPVVWSKARSAALERPALFSLHHLWRQTGADGGFTWIHPAPWEGTPDAKQIQTRLEESYRFASENPTEVIPSAFPGYRDVYGTAPDMGKSHPQIPHRDGDTMRESLQAAMRGPWGIIQLVTWNDYGEGTMIEPTHEFGYTFLEIIQAQRRSELGKDFTFMADDLRLPAHLFRLRKDGSHPAESLDRISTLLSEGNCQAARTRLERLEATAKPNTEFKKAPDYRAD